MRKVVSDRKESVYPTCRIASSYCQIPLYDNVAMLYIGIIRFLLILGNPVDSSVPSNITLMSLYENRQG